MQKKDLCELDIGKYFSDKPQKSLIIKLKLRLYKEILQFTNKKTNPIKAHE